MCCECVHWNGILLHCSLPSHQASERATSDFFQLIFASSRLAVSHIIRKNQHFNNSLHCIKPYRFVLVSMVIVFFVWGSHNVRLTRALWSVCARLSLLRSRREINVIRRMNARPSPPFFPASLLSSSMLPSVSLCHFIHLLFPHSPFALLLPLSLILSLNPPPPLTHGRSKLESCHLNNRVCPA